MDVVGFAGGGIGVVEDGEVGELLGEGIASRVGGLGNEPGRIMGIEIAQDVTIGDGV